MSICARMFGGAFERNAILHLMEANRSSGVAVVRCRHTIVSSIKGIREEQTAVAR